VDHIKRLALLFDEVHYLLPTPSILKFDVAEQWEKAGVFSGQGKPAPDFDFFRDTERAFELLPLDDQLQEAIDVLGNHGVVIKCEYPREDSSEADFREVRDLFIALDAADPAFNRLSNTEPTDYRLLIRGVQVEWDNGELFNFYSVPEPNAVSDSYTISASLYAANALSCFPIFLKPRHRAEIEYRYEQYKSGLGVLRERYPELISPADFRARFGEVTFTVANSVLASHAISSMSPNDILRYRQELNDARRKYLVNDLMELSNIVTDNPWSTQVRSELERYVYGKLNTDLLKYDEASRDIWGKTLQPNARWGCGRRKVNGRRDRLGRAAGKHNTEHVNMGTDSHWGSDRSGGKSPESSR
jgi:hypothetical protein